MSFIAARFPVSTFPATLAGVLVVAIVFGELAPALAIEILADFVFPTPACLRSTSPLLPLASTLPARTSTGPCTAVLNSINPEDGFAKGGKTMAICEEDVLTSSDLVSDGLVVHDDARMGGDLLSGEKSFDIFRVLRKFVLAVGKEEGDCS